MWAHKPNVLKTWHLIIYSFILFWIFPNFGYAIERLQQESNKDLIFQTQENYQRDVLYNDGLREDLLDGNTLISQLYPKSLELLQLTDLVLTSDIEGNLNAINRHTGELLWSLESGHSIVEIESSDEDDYKYSGMTSTSQSSISASFPTSSIMGNKIYEYINTTNIASHQESNHYKKRKNKIVWLVEPYGDGAIYQFTREEGLKKLPVSIKQFIMNSPFSINDDFVYTGSRHSGIVKINALTGAVVEHYGFEFEGDVILGNDEEHLIEDDPLGDYYAYRFNDNIDDLQEDAFIDDHDEGPFITIGRTVYDLTIHAKNNTSWNITYVQWGPNNLHSNLMNQNSHSKDNLYIQPFHDNSILAMDSEAKMVKWVANLPYTTINVFDIFQDSEEDNKFVLLPHPIDQASLSLKKDREDSTFIDKTKEGSWYALSEFHYPSLVRSAPIAKYITSKKWREDSILLNNDLFTLSIRGVHDDSIKAKVDESDTSDKNVAIYNPIKFPTAIQKAPPQKYDPSRRLPDSAKYFEEHYYGDYDGADDEGVTKSPTSTYKQSILKELTYRALENVIVALLCLSIVYLLNRLGLINFLNFQQLQAIPKREGNDINDENPNSEGADGEVMTHDGTVALEEKAERKTKVVQINDTVEVLNPDEIENIDENSLLPSEEAVKKKRKRGSRGGKKNKKKEPIEEVEEEGSVEIEQLTKISNNLSITDEILGFGSHGTIVFKGYFENRPVAVKRMLLDFYDVASHEISLLQESDDHSNVIRYFCSQEYNKFLYIALELCSASLEDVVEKKEINVGTVPQNILWQIANGVYHLHSLKIVHRDIKPQNILVVLPKKADGELRFLISDFGLCKRLEADQSSFRGTTANAAGTAGWRAPELLLDASKQYTKVNTTVRLTRALDIFSTGCVFYYVLTGGRHPFGDRFIREGEIIRGQYHLNDVDHLRDAVEIKDLISSMINKDPLKRPDIDTVMKHPYFWSTQRKMEFLLKVSDRFEVERRDPPSPLLIKFESIALKVLGSKGWFQKFDTLFLDNLGKYRKYNTHKLMDLLRAIRNKHHHYQDLPAELASEIGSLSDGFYWYFAEKFPLLLMSIYEACRDLIGDSDQMKSFYN